MHMLHLTSVFTNDMQFSTSASASQDEKGLKPKLNESWRSGATGKPCGAGLAANPAGLGSTAKLGEILAMAKGPSTKMHSATVQRAGSKSSGPSPRFAGPSRTTQGWRAVRIPSSGIQLPLALLHDAGTLWDQREGHLAVRSTCKGHAVPMKVCEDGGTSETQRRSTGRREPFGATSASSPASIMS